MPYTGEHLRPGTIRGDTASLAVAKRLDAIGGVVSSLDLTALRSRDDVTRALCMLDFANQCIEVVLKEIESSLVRGSLSDQSERLMQLIELTRNEVASFH